MRTALMGIKESLGKEGDEQRERLSYEGKVLSNRSEVGGNKIGVKINYKCCEGKNPQVEKVALHCAKSNRGCRFSSPF